MHCASSSYIVQYFGFIHWAGSYICMSVYTVSLTTYRFGWNPCWNNIWEQTTWLTSSLSDESSSFLSHSFHFICSWWVQTREFYVEKTLALTPKLDWIQFEGRRRKSKERTRKGNFREKSFWRKKKIVEGVSRHVDNFLSPLPFPFPYHTNFYSKTKLKVLLKT